MQKLLLAILLLNPFFCFSQQSLHQARQASWYMHAYKISAAEALKYMNDEHIPIDQFLTQSPKKIDFVSIDSLPLGHYVLVSANKNALIVELYNKSNLRLMVLNNHRNLQFGVLDKNGNEIQPAQVFLKGKRLKYDKSSQTYTAHTKSRKIANVVVQYPGDTLITEIDEDWQMTRSVAEQRRANYKNSNFYKFITWIPQSLKSLFSANKRSNSQVKNEGYILFNQPKFKPADTVKFKGYILDKKWNQYVQPIQVFVSYSSRGTYTERLITRLEATTPGAYVGEFALADSIPSGTNVRLVYKNLKGRTLISRMFKVEDYLLDEVSSRNIRSSKEIYYVQDSLFFFASSKDANGLNIMDGTVELILLTRSIDKTFQDSVYISDTLYHEVKALSNQSETKFELHSNIFPNVNVEINAVMKFKNSNNEIHEERKEISYKYSSFEVVAHQQADSVFAQVLKNGSPIHAVGSYAKGDGPDLPIQYPFKDRLDPFEEDYYFNFKNDSLDLSTDFEPSEYKIYSRSVTRGDSLGFNIQNPFQISIYYSVFDGKKLLESGKFSGDNFSWMRLQSDKNKIWNLVYSYYWAGENHTEKISIALDYKILDIKLDIEEKVYPGQQDAIKVKVVDYRGAPAPNVNLSLASYNNQFGNLNYVDNPPILARYTSGKYIEREGMLLSDNEGFYFMRKYNLGDYRKWLSALGLDTMRYYKLLFPKNNIHIEYTPTLEFTPQIAVHVFDNGVQEEIYLLYIDNVLKYYNGVTDKSNYAFSVSPKPVKIGIRLKHKFIEIDSVYFQPNYKHDLSIDLQHLPANVRVTTAKNYWSDAEVKLIERSMWQFNSNRQFNQSFVWQNKELYPIGMRIKHIIGPFAPYELKFLSPGKMDFKFKFESGYEYSLAENIIRLEKHSIFPPKQKKKQKYFLPFVKPLLKLGDTLSELPEFAKMAMDTHSRLTINGHLENTSHINHLNTGKLRYDFLRKDTLQYLIVLDKDSGRVPLIFNPYVRFVSNLIPGNYDLILVNNQYEAATENILVKSSSTLYLNLNDISFHPNNPILDSLLQDASEKRQLLKDAINKQTFELRDSIYFTKADMIDSLLGGTIVGTILDDQGKMPIAFASISIVGSAFGIISDQNGKFTLNHIKPGYYEVLVSSFGYVSKRIELSVMPKTQMYLEVKLLIADEDLEEVVVTGFASVKRTMYAGSMSVVANDKLAGRVSGVSIQNSAYESIFIRGSNSILGSNSPIYVVDGIIKVNMDGLQPDRIESIVVLSGMEAAAIYGSIAADGAIIIQTKMKVDRSIFRDYAFWVPNFFSDENGEAKVSVTFPDNITTWKTFVVGMDKQRRVGKAVAFTQSYKPMLAQINLPRFLLENDTVDIVTKTLNYENRLYNLKTKFSLNDVTMHTRELDLPAMEANILKERISATHTDSLKLEYEILSTTGYKDKEMRKIPVRKIGIKESEGAFYVLQSDSTIHFASNQNLNNLHIYAQNNTLELLLNEIEMLKVYPHYCMEQISSKVLGYIFEKEIREKLNQPFKHERALDALVKRLQEGQNYDGGWGWFKSGNSNIYISNYITTALFHIKNEIKAETNLADAYQYLANSLHASNTGGLLTTLITLSRANYAMDFRRWIDKIKFDSLSVFQQWELVFILKDQKLPYKNYLDRLVQKRNQNLMGAVYWGDENFIWYNNEVATTVLAFEILQDEPQYQNLLQGIVNWFLTKRKNGYWRNTVESASIIKLILPWALRQPQFLSDAGIRISGDTNFVISKFPYKLELENSNFKNLTFTKFGGGLVYFTAYQHLFNPSPQQVNEHFDVQVSYTQQAAAVDSIRAGSLVNMQVKIRTKAVESFVMVEIPIPAGCVIANNAERTLPGHVEKYDDKLMLFLDELPKGDFEMNIQLEPRYSGAFTVNPAKVSLMYFPVFYGINNLEKVRIWE